MEVTLKTTLLFLLLSSAKGDPKTTTLLKTTAVDEVSGESGIIEFDGHAHSDLKRKIWIIHGNANHWDVTLVLEENKLGKNAHLTVQSIPGSSQGWNGSQVDWRNENKFINGSNIILVTLSMKNSEQSPLDLPSFKLRFNSTMTKDHSQYVNSKEVMRIEGTQFVSHPPQNKQNFPPVDFYYSLIAPASGNQFRLTLKYLDIPGVPLQCGHMNFGVYFLRDHRTGTKFEFLPGFRKCGRTGHISDVLGHSEVALLYFWFRKDEGGRGFKVQVDPLVDTE